MSIVVLGAVFVDIKGYPSANYIPFGRNAGRVRYVHGGVSRNIAEDLGNMDLSPVFISLVDDTGVGADVIKRLREHGVSTEYIRSVPEGMGTWLAVFDNNNDVCASISHRPDLMPVRDTILKYGNAIFQQADSVLLELDMDREIVEDVFSLSEEYGKRVYAAVSNINIAVERREYFPRLSCLVCNRNEAEILFSACLPPVSPEALSKELASLVLAAQLPAMVVTLGGEGAIWANREGEHGFCPAYQVPVADTTGAGDAFFAGVAAGLTYGKLLPEACKIGSRLASSVICSLDNTCPHFLPAEFGLQRC